MLKVNILAMLLSPEQLMVVIGLGALVCAFIALNVWLGIFLSKRGVRKLCTHQLQNKRNALLEQLALLRGGGVLISAEEEEEDEETEEVEDDVDMLIVNEEDDDEDDADEEQPVAQQNNFGVVEREEADETMGAEILYVEKLSAAMREKLGFADKAYDKKRYYVRYTLSFEARLRSADDEVKQRYVDVLNEISLYKNLKVKGSYRQQRIFKGRKTLGLLLFSGKTLCIAFALNPADYEQTKFRGIDKSSRRRFKNTPMMMRLTSSRKVEYARYLLVQLADANTIVLDEHPKTPEFDFATKTREELYLENKLQITVLGEVPDSVEYEQPEENVGDEIDTDDDNDGEGESAATDAESTKYNRSYTARVIQADDELKARYSEIKNHIVAYSGVFNAITWQREAFYAAKRDCFAMFAIRGRTLCLFLAVDAKRFENTKYKVEDRTQQVRNARMPSMFRIKSDRGTKYAKELIDMVLAEKGVKVHPDYKPVNYRPAYRCTENLIRNGYIRVKTSSAPSTDTATKTQEEKKAPPVKTAQKAEKKAPVKEIKAQPTAKEIASEPVNESEKRDN